MNSTPRIQYLLYLKQKGSYEECWGVLIVARPIHMFLVSYESASLKIVAYFDLVHQHLQGSVRQILLW